MSDSTFKLPQADWTSDDGSVVLYCRNCLDVLNELPDGCVDAVVTDPPYAVSVAKSKHVGKPGCGTRNLDFFEGDDDWAEMRERVLRAATLSLSVLASHGSAYWCCGHRQFGDLVTLFESRGFRTRFLVWSKIAPAPAPPGAGWSSAAELCVYAYRGGRRWCLPHGLNPNVICADGFRNGQPGKVDHPTQKPLVTMSKPIEACSYSGDSILDPYMGSATAGVACVRLGRKFIGCELKPEYFDIAVKRIQQAFDDQALFRQDEPKHEQMELISKTATT